MWAKKEIIHCQDSGKRKFIAENDLKVMFNDVVVKPDSVIAVEQAKELYQSKIILALLHLVKPYTKTLQKRSKDLLCITSKKIQEIKRRSSILLKYHVELQTIEIFQMIFISNQQKKNLRENCSHYGEMNILILKTTSSQ